MVIGIDASRANLSKRTGTEWYSYNLIINLAKIDSQNRYFLYSKEPLQEELRDLPPNFKNKVLNWPPRRLWTQIRLSLEMLINPPEILFVPAHTIPLIHPSRTITTCHDIGFERFPQLYSKTDLKYHRWAMKLAVKKAQRIIAVSQFTKNEIIDVYNINPEKVVVIYHGFNKDIYHPIKDELKVNSILKKYKISKPFILYIGRLELKKNTPGLVKAFGILKQSKRWPHKLVLTGQEGYGSDEINKNINSFKLFNEVIKVGYIPAKDLPFIISATDLFILPSFYEGFGLPVLEAMACGCPVIASRIASLPEIVGEAGFLVNPRNPEDIMRAMDRVLEDQNLREQMIQKGFKWVQNFSWEKSALKTLEVLKSMMKG